MADPAARPRRRRSAAMAVPLLAAVIASLVSALAGGLLRAGVPLSGAIAGPWLDQAAASHAALMICGFLGTVIGIERAVALRRPAGWTVPLASASGAVCTLVGWPAAGAVAFVVASIAFVAVNALLVARQQAGHTVLLLVAAILWAGANLLAALPANPGGPSAVIAGWFGFLVLTIAAERLEMTRLMRRSRAVHAVFHGTVVSLVAGIAVSMAWPVAGGLVFGAALVLLAGWLLMFDIARRTIRTAGLTRYMATCLLGGYAWLGIGGLAWCATALGLPARDIALHALGLGFVIGMVMAHAPVILPAVAGVKLAFGPMFYLAPALLHATLAWRFLAPIATGNSPADGATGNTIAIVSFAATVIGAVIVWRLRHRRAGVSGLVLNRLPPS